LSLVIHENVDLTQLNTFGIAAMARYFSHITSTNALLELFKNKLLSLDKLAPDNEEKSMNLNLNENPDLFQSDGKDFIKSRTFYKSNFLCLGEGSNILFVQSYPGIVLKNEIKGIEILKETDDGIQLKVGAGENWNDFVLYCVNRGWGGLENLTLIPGTVGAAPIQNIGAYGVEVKDFIDTVEFYDVTSDQMRHFKKEDCQFAYRDSIFKKQGKGKWIITSVYFTLAKKPIIKTSYGAIQSELQNRQCLNPTIKDISEIVMTIRRSKLPDPKQLGNAGSFFKNPIVSKEQYTNLKTLHSQLVAFPETTGDFKLAAGWLIESCGLKGFKQDRVGVHSQQALVLVNYGGATGQEIFALSEMVKAKVFEKFQIHLETEVQIINNTNLPKL